MPSENSDASPQGRRVTPEEKLRTLEAGDINVYSGTTEIVGLTGQGMRGI